MADRVINVQSAADRVAVSMADDFAYLCRMAAEELAPKVESEIELMVLTTLVMVGRLTRMKFYVGDEDPSTPWEVRIVPQYQWHGYRIDFCITMRSRKRIFVECDGHDFHERTKEQAERDRSKDREIQASGIPILRFTGREIWRDTTKVALEILNFMDSAPQEGEDG